METKQNTFLDDLFGEQEGIVYSPVKGEGWQQHFFEWPAERQKLEEHVSNYNSRDVYISPVLFTEKRISPETFRGTNYLWTEFDGTLPLDFIEPTIRVSSSIDGHEHWYWKLDTFVTDKVLVEDLTKRIAYHYGADLSVWDYQNVLRPIDTWNHKRNKPVTLVSKTDSVYTVESFLWVPIPPANTKVDFKVGELPPREIVLAKYKWKDNTLDLLFKQVEQGHRSNALLRLAFDAVEAGCSNEEVYVLIEERDRVWGKYLGRSDREKQLKACISFARGKKLVAAELHQEATTELYRFKDFMDSTIKMKWAIEGLVPVAGSMVIAGKPGIGKTMFSLRMGMALSLGKEKFLQWPVLTRQRTLFISLEMQHAELKEFFSDMNLTEEEQLELQEWFYIWPIGFAYPFDVPDQQGDLLKFIDQHKIEHVIIDSLGLSMYGSTTNDDDVKRLNSYMNEDIRSKRTCGYTFIHHDRKSVSGDLSKVGDLDDIFGSRYITANAQTVMLLSQKKNSSKLHVLQLKTRMTVGLRDFDVERTPDRGFVLVGDTNSSDAPVTVITGETESDQRTNVRSLGDIFSI